MLNQRKLYVSMITSLLLIAMVTVVAADDAIVTPEAAVQNADDAIVCMQEEDLQQEETLLGEMVTFHLEERAAEAEDSEAAAEESIGAEEETAGADDEMSDVAAETTEVEDTEGKGTEPEEAEPVAPASETTERESLAVLESADLWVEVYEDLVYGEPTAEKLAVLAMIETKNQELALMSCDTDHIVNYQGTKYVISDDEYRILLHIVEAEAPDEDVEGRMLVANVILNRAYGYRFPDTITEVVFQKGQFAPVTNGILFKRTISEETIEAVERVLDGEDYSQGALYFMARSKASKEGKKFFDENLEFLFKHGRHEFYTEK